MTSELHKELEENNLAKWLTEHQKDYKKWLFIGGIGVVILLGGVLTYAYYEDAKSQRLNEAWTAFYDSEELEDYRDVLKEYEDTPVKGYAKLRIADLIFHDAQMTHASDGFKAASEQFDDALKLYQELIDNADQLPAEFKRESLRGKALVLETTGKIEEAKEVYQYIQQEYPGYMDAFYAENKIKMLDEESVKDMLAKYVAYEPIPSDIGDLPLKDDPLDIKPPVDLPDPSTPDLNPQKPDIDTPPSTKDDSTATTETESKSDDAKKEEAKTGDKKTDGSTADESKADESSKDTDSGKQAAGSNEQKKADTAEQSAKKADAAEQSAKKADAAEQSAKKEENKGEGGNL